MRKLPPEEKQRRKLLRRRLDYADNRERDDSSNRAYVKAHPEKIREIAARCYQKHKARRAIKAAKYRRENRAKLKRQKDANHAAHPEKRRTSWLKRHAKEKSATIGNAKLIEAWEVRWKKLRRVTCYWCRNEFRPKKCHSDHVIPLSKGGSHAIENLCISCQPCNNRKSTKPLSDWNTQIAQPVLF